MISIRVDPRAVLGALGDIHARQVPYAISLGLNRLAAMGQKAEQNHIKQSFRLRRESFVLRGVKINKLDRATKTKWSVTITLSYPENRHFLDIHEPGGTRIRHGGKRLWLPNPEVFRSRIIGRSNSLHPSQIGLRRAGNGRIQGNAGTFMVKTGRSVLLLQRTERTLTKASKRRLGSMTLDNVAVGMGPHRRREKSISRNGGTRMLYRLVERVRIPARLEFVDTITSTVNKHMQSVMAQALNDAIATRR